MQSLKITPSLAVLAVCALTMAGCSSAKPVPYSNISSSAMLKPNFKDDTGHIPYSYSTAPDWRQYDKVIVNPVTIYNGSDHQFDDMSEEDKKTLAKYMQQEFSEKLSSQYSLANQPGPNTLQVNLTLTGAETSTPVLSTFTRFDIGGGIYNGVQSARGGEGLFTGAVMYAVEIYDTENGTLLKSFVSKQYPNAYNIPATLGSLKASKVSIEKGAEALLEQMK